MRGGVRELLVISQDTSATASTGYAEREWRGKPYQTRCRPCAKGGRTRRVDALHYVYPYPHVDDIIP